MTEQLSLLSRTCKGSLMGLDVLVLPGRSIACSFRLFAFSFLPWLCNLVVVATLDLRNGRIV